MRRENFTPSKYAVLCVKHFREEDLDRTSLSCVRLRENVVPSVFPAFPDHLKQKAVSRRKPPKERNVSTPVQQEVIPMLPQQHAIPTPPPSTPASDTEVLLLNNHMIEDGAKTANTPRKQLLKRKLEETETKLNLSRKVIKLLQQKNRWMVKRTANLKAVLADLKKNELLSNKSSSILHNSAGGIEDLLAGKPRRMGNLKRDNTPGFTSEAFTALRM